MRVLADFHHQALYHSLHLLFEERLGWELYRPIGKEWWEQKYWKVYDHPHTAEQFLGLHQATSIPMDVHGAPLPEVERKNLHYTIEDGIYYVKDLSYGTIHRAIRLDKFKDMEFDILLSSIPDHIGPYNNLIRQFQPKAKHIFQVGNRWTTLPGINNIMASTAPFATNANVVFYHQEIDLNIFNYEPPTFHNTIHSYVHYMKKPYLMDHVLNDLPGWQGIKYGAGMQQQIQGMKDVAAAYKRSAWTWQFKPGGDGFGHVIHGSYACGRPVIYAGSHYNGCIANGLLEHMITGIDIEKIGRHGRRVANTLKQLSDPEKHTKICEAAYQRFNNIVNYDSEFEEIQKFLERLR